MSIPVLQAGWKYYIKHIDSTTGGANLNTKVDTNNTNQQLYLFYGVSPTGSTSSQLLTQAEHAAVAGKSGVNQIHGNDGFSQNYGGLKKS